MWVLKRENREMREGEGVFVINFQIWRIVGKLSMSQSPLWNKNKLNHSLAMIREVSWPKESSKVHD